MSVEPSRGRPVSWRAETRPCPQCRSTAHRRLGSRGGAAHHSGRGIETGVVRCRECHLVYQRPFLIPAGNPYEEYAPEEYFPSHVAAERIGIGESLARRAEVILGRRGRLLELGCGTGELLVGAARAGWTVAGIDMTAGFASVHPELDIEIAPVEEAQRLEQTHDVIVLAAILEHLYDPVACLTRVARALVPGGLVFIDVPNECSFWTIAGNAYMRMRGRAWAVNLSPTFPPFHVVGFCPTSLTRLLKSSGFEIVELRTHRWENDLPRRPGLSGCVERTAAGAALSVGAMIGMGAGISCWARKR